MVSLNDNVSVQLSVDGVASLSIISGVITTWPSASNETVISWATTVGLSLSTTVTIIVSVVTLL